MALLEIDELQATAILDMQLRRLAALERQKIIDGWPSSRRSSPTSRTSWPARSGSGRSSPRSSPTIVDKFGDERRSQIIAADGDLSMEDLIPDEDLVVTITRGGYAKRTRADLYRTQKRGGKGVRGATLRGDDVVEHFMAHQQPPLAAVLHHRRPGLPHQGLQPARGVARRQGRSRRRAAVASSPTSRSPQVLAIRDYEQAPYLVLATRNGLVKKTRLGDYNSPRQAGVIAINFREDDDELIGAELVRPGRRHPAGLPQGPGDPVPRRRRPAAADGPGDLRRHRHEVPRRRQLLSMSVIRPTGRGRGGRDEPPAADAEPPGRGAVRLHDHRRRLRQAHPDRGLPPAVPRRSRHQGDEAGRRPGQPGRRASSWSRATRCWPSSSPARSPAARSTTTCGPPAATPRA